MKSSIDSMDSSQSLLKEKGYNGRQGLLLIAISVLLHLGFLLGLVAAQNYRGPRVTPQAIQVNLVSYTPLPGQDSPSPASDSVQEKTMARPVDSQEEAAVVLSKKKQVKPAHEKKEVKPSKKKPPKKKRALKRKTYKPEKVLKSARETLADSLEKKSRNTLQKALSRLENQVEKKSRKGSGTGDVASDSTGGAKNSQAIDLYNLELMYKIKQNWAFNERLAGAQKNLEVRILIKLLKEGDLRDIWFETRSGNRHLDDSALKAVKKSAPFSPLPKGYTSYDVGLIFTPSGLK